MQRYQKISTCINNTVIIKSIHTCWNTLRNKCMHKINKMKWKKKMLNQYVNECIKKYV